MFLRNRSGNTTTIRRFLESSCYGTWFEMIEGPLLADGNSGYSGNMGEVNSIPTRRTASATRQPQMRPSLDHGYLNNPGEEYLQR